MWRLLVLSSLVLSGHCYEDNNGYDVEESERVVGGTEAKRHSWPSQISLQFISGNSWRHNCGGTLIRTNWVMTAAHCVDNNWTYRVVVGDHNYQTHEGTEQYINVAKIIRHANWNRNNIVGGWDIALVKLASHAVLNSYVQLGRLPAEGQILSNNYPCIVTGWGNTMSGGYLAANLQQAPLPVVDYRTCSSSNYWGTSAKSSMVCAGGNGLQAGCQGDSGGPLNCAVSGTYYVHGVTSFVSTSGCNVVRKPTMFTRVSAYITWMDNVMRNN